MLPSDGLLCEETVNMICGERRARRRYPIALPVQFNVVKNYSVVHSGTGTTINISSGGIAIETMEVLKPRSYVELSIGWPVKLNQTCPLKLVASGRVLRSDSVSTVIQLERYEFRTQRLAAHQAMAQSVSMVGS